jgi:subtilisin family serine protease
MTKRFSPSLATFLAVVIFSSAMAVGSSFTPLEWQKVVRKHRLSVFVGQRKHTTWIRDQNRNFIDDEIEARYHRGEVLNVVVDLNACLPPEKIKSLLGNYGRITYVGKLITFVLVDRVRFDDLPKIAALPEVSMIELQEVGQIMNDVSNRAVQARKSVTFSPNTAEDHGFIGTGVNVAILDTGVDDTHEAFTGKFVAGFNTFDPTDPGDGSRHTGDDHGHGTHVAGTVLANETPGRNCRTPDDGSPTDCGGMAPGAGVVAIKICNAGGGCPNVQQGLDWLGLHATQFHVRVANMSIGFCTDDDGNSAMAQQVNYLAALGVAMVIAHGNSTNCGLAGGTKRTMFPGSASFAITVGAVDDGGSVAHAANTHATFFLVGPRSDFNLVSPDLLALKPDISAPGVNIFSALAGSMNGYFSDSGTSMASPHVAGAAADIIQARPDIDPGSLKELLRHNADTTHNVPAFPAVDPNWDTGFGAGVLNVWNAINAAAATDVGFPSCAGPPATPGGICTLLPPNPPWENSVDITTATPPTVGMPNTITAQVKNFGGVPATVLVNFGVYEFAVGNNQFFHIGTVQVTVPPGATVPVNQPWTPDSPSHQCVQINIAYALDTNYANNVTQRNLSIAPSVFAVRVENPYMVPARFEVRVRSRNEKWQCKAAEQSFVLQPFECPHMLRVAFNAPKGTEPGQHENCEVAVYATPEKTDKRQLIGGVTLQTIVPKPCQFVGTVVGAAGEPLSDALVAFEMNDAEVTGADVPKPVEITTSSAGTFSITLVPFRTYRVLIAKEGIGKGEIKLKPMCGVCLKFVLTHEGAEIGD